MNKLREPLLYTVFTMDCARYVLYTVCTVVIYCLLFIYTIRMVCLLFRILYLARSTAVINEITKIILFSEYVDVSKSSLKFGSINFPVFSTWQLLPDVLSIPDWELPEEKTDIFFKNFWKWQTTGRRFSIDIFAKSLPHCKYNCN